jgi:hypothetical protein
VPASNYFIAKTIPQKFRSRKGLWATKVSQPSTKMRTPRLVILGLFFAASTFIFLRSLTAVARANVLSTRMPRTSSTRRFTSFFAFSTPFTLFPPNAAISLADDNSTSFAARPAAFGPPLPAKGLSGQVWIGSGFADDNLQEGEGEGELGCSDLPDYNDGTSSTVPPSMKVAKGNVKEGGAGRRRGRLRRSHGPASPLDRTTPAPGSGAPSVPVDDGTDDYLHEGRTSLPKVANVAGSSGAAHADIQSLQEAAEIAGKIVLLSRGGCGFLEKVKWAQRRGAKALIVGDNRKGGPLIQMFARGDTSNISIPSVFTSRTTAHLLSSLMQPGSFIEDSIDEHGNAVLKVQHSVRTKGKKKAKAKTDTSNSDTAAARSTRRSEKGRPTLARRSVEAQPQPVPRAEGSGWVWNLFSWTKGRRSVEERSRPPSSGQLDWVLVDEWDDKKDKIITDSLGKAARGGGESNAKSGSRQGSDDSFQIGVQDWRDPDMVSKPDAHGTDTESGSNPNDGSLGTGSDSMGRPVASKGPKGGSITPGSGEYDPESGPSGAETRIKAGSSDLSTTGQGGLMSKLLGDDDDTAEALQNDLPPPPDAPVDRPEDPGPPETMPPEREGLWITITPTNGTSSFFDTLLVLVISPLITLSVVYALLILRARIRRRRWRAPKSVVDRLPVRTYHTVTSSPSHTPRVPSPTSSSPTTPLLQQPPPPPGRPRPRSRTTTGVPESGNTAASFLTVSDIVHGGVLPSRPLLSTRADREKASGHHISSEWKKYMGKQVECAVCLEEYVDGVSRVMSLPCGHEFHADCM